MRGRHVTARRPVYPHTLIVGGLCQQRDVTAHRGGRSRSPPQIAAANRSVRPVVNGPTLDFPAQVASPSPDDKSPRAGRSWARDRWRYGDPWNTAGVPATNTADLDVASIRGRLRGYGHPAEPREGALDFRFLTVLIAAASWATRRRPAAQGPSGTRPAEHPGLTSDYAGGMQMALSATTSLASVTVVSFAVFVVAGPSQLTGHMQDPPTEPKGPTFEVASVKPNRSSSINAGIRMLADRFEATSVPLRGLISLAFGEAGPPPQTRANDQIVGGPSWMNTELVRHRGQGRQRYVPPGPAGVGQKLLMLRSLLEQRFKLTVHHERGTPPFTLWSWPAATGHSGLSFVRRMSIVTLC